VGSATAIILLPKPGELFTEFYILGPEGLAESYPRAGAVGEPLAVTVGITNREGAAAGYRVEVRNGGALIGAAGPVRLADGERWEGEVGFAPAEVGPDVRIDFLLYRDERPEPYRSLRLWLEVRAGP